MGKIVLEDFNEGDGYYKINLAYLNKKQVEDIEKFVEKWNETEDERIRKELLDFCKNRAENYPNDPKYKNISAWIAWLENQGEQKSIDSLTQQEAMDIAVAKCFEEGEQKPAEEYNITGIGSKNAQGKLGKMIKKLKHDNEVLEQKSADEEMKEALRTEYEKGRADVIAEMQKPAWSEEDEAHINGIIDYLLDYKLFVYEEDMNVANGVQKELDWLKSISPQNKWKPSEEQIRYLQAVVNDPKNAGAESCHNALEKLLEQLKGLKEL